MYYDGYMEHNFFTFSDQAQGFFSHSQCVKMLHLRTAQLHRFTVKVGWCACPRKSSVTVNQCAMR